MLFYLNDALGKYWCLTLAGHLYNVVIQFRAPPRKWTSEANEILRGRFEATDWDVFYDSHGEDIDGLTDCITDYICVDDVVPFVIWSCSSSTISFACFLFLLMLVF